MKSKAISQYMASGYDLQANNARRNAYCRNAYRRNAYRRNAYIHALRAADGGDFEPLLVFVAKR